MNSLKKLLISTIASQHIAYISPLALLNMCKIALLRSHRRIKNSTSNAIFLDCDGTLWPDSGPGCFLDQSLLNLPHLNQVFNLSRKYDVVFLITNQSFFARSSNYSIQDLTRFFLFYRKLACIFHAYAVLICLHHPEAQNNSLRVRCDFRKPNSKMFWMAESLADFDYTKSLILGDRISDIYSGYRSGLADCVALYNKDFFSHNYEMCKDTSLETIIFKVIAPEIGR